jgi:ParB family chromosome partitioning protein
LEHQVRIFNKLKSRAGESSAINQEICGGHNDRVDVLLKFVGQKDYEAAGHHINSSLFDDDDRHPIAVTNVPALKAMAAAKVAAECERFKKDGWAWAIPRDEAPKDIYAWRRLPGGAPSKEQKAHAGCTVSISFNGQLEVERGYIKPGDKVRVEKTPAQKAAAKKVKITKEEAAGISGNLAFRLSKTITLAAADALIKDPWLAMRFAIAALASGGGVAMRLEMHGMPELGGDEADNEFEKYFALVSKKSTGELPAMLATWLVKSLNFQCHSASSLPLSSEYAEEDAPIILNEINGEELIVALRKRFDAADYFAGVSKELCLAAIAESLPKITVNKSLPKAKIVAIATEQVPKTGWLPRELRTVHYKGPGAKVAGKKPARKKK